MSIEQIIEWIVLLPAGMKLATAIGALILVIAYTSLRPGDPTA